MVPEVTGVRSKTRSTCPTRVLCKQTHGAVSTRPEASSRNHCMTGFADNPANLVCETVPALCWVDVILDLGHAV